MKIGIIGAGLSGLTLATLLNDNHERVIFEKSRGVGGRMSTRHTDDFQFDHGAQFFTARTKPFQQFLAPFIARETVVPWSPKVITLERHKKPYKREWFEPHFIASPSMTSLCKEMARTLERNTKKKADLLKSHHITEMRKHSEGWILLDSNNNEHGLFDWVITTVPVQQALDLLPKTFSEREKLEQAKQEGCFSLMLGFDEPLPIHFQAARVKDSIIDWISVDSQKPGRISQYALIVHSTNSWAEKHLNDDRDWLKEQMLNELNLLFQPLMEKPFKPIHAVLHAWRYASTSHLPGEEPDTQSEHESECKTFIDGQQKLAACGDWCVEGRVEGAFLSAYYLSNHLSDLLD